MPLESATYINSLNSSNPVSTDSVAQADDHIRLIKSTIKATFPNISGPVTASQSALNSPIPSGIIAMWSGSLLSVPSGWLLCDGTAGTPNLIDRFIVGAGSAYAVSATGGSTGTSAAGGHTHTEVAAGSHNHTGVVGNTALTLDQMPSHTHSTAIKFETDIAGGGTRDGLVTSTFTSDGTSSYTTTSAGSGDAHNHTIDTDGSHSHTINAVGDHSHTVTPPYYALAYIMKS